MLYFILGVLFVLLIYPVIESLSSLILTAIEVAKGYLNTKIMKYNTQLKQMSSEEDNTINPIGFFSQEEDEDE